jgi:hypothetical protein
VKRKLFVLSPPDLLDPRLVPSRFSTGLLIAGALCCAAAAIRWHQAEQSVERARLDLAAAQMLSAQVTRPVERPVTPQPRRAAASSGESSRPTRPAEADRQAMQQFLAVDWNRRLHMVEQAAAGQVNLLGLKLDAQRSILEMRGEIASIQRFDALSRQLLDGGAQAVHLQRHEALRQDSGIKQVFVASAEWTK